MGTDISHLLTLPISEQLEIIEILWNNIRASQEANKLPQWQVDEIERRLADQSETIDEDEFWRRVDGKEPAGLHAWQEHVLEERGADTCETIGREELWRRVDGK